MHKKVLSFVVLLALCSIPALAATGSFGFATFGTSLFAPTGKIGDATSITIPDTSQVMYNANGYFDAGSGHDKVPLGTEIHLAPNHFAWPGPGAYLIGYVDLLTWNGSNSKFSATEMFVEQTHPSSDASTGSLTLHFYGTYTDAANSLSEGAELIFSGSQQGLPPSNLVDLTGTFQIPGGTPPPPTPTPEPATMLLMGTALIGLGFVRPFSKR